MSEQSTWVFGYGSLIYKVDFPFQESAVGRIHGWQRRFWQGSHDHRGTPDAPGRVVTLVEEPGASCIGVAYRVTHAVFEHLDHREKNGYERVEVDIHLRDCGSTVAGLMYHAAEDNPAFLGPASLEELAAHIGSSHGPSGSNRDYLLYLAEALRELGDQDEHVFALEALLTTSPP
ncbi:MAG: gamma-glutamylcyclotransferase [Pseudomonadota bacterium]